jgi:hypothetical protein
MGNVWGKEKPLKEVLRENKRMITRAVRELDREKNALEREEKRITMEIKKAAKENQMASVKIMAKVSTVVLTILQQDCLLSYYSGGLQMREIVEDSTSFCIQYLLIYVPQFRFTFSVEAS